MGVHVIMVRYFAAAKAAAGVAGESFDAPAAGLSRAELFSALAARHPEPAPGEPDLARVLAQSSALADGIALVDGQLIGDGQTVDVLPPFAGG